MKFRWSELEVEATRWFKNGDHPLDYVSEQPGASGGDLTTFTGAERREKGWEGEVVRHYNNPDVQSTRQCAICGSLMLEHGWLDFPPHGQPVCPGDWIVTLPDSGAAMVKLIGGFRAISNTAFLALVLESEGA